MALTSVPAGASGLSGGHNLASVVSTGEEGPLKKPKKERKERGRENGKEERECSVVEYKFYCRLLLIMDLI